MVTNTNHIINNIFYKIIKVNDKSLKNHRNQWTVVKGEGRPFPQGKKYFLSVPPPQKKMYSGFVGTVRYPPEHSYRK